MPESDVYAPAETKEQLRQTVQALTEQMDGAQQRFAELAEFCREFSAQFGNAKQAFQSALEALE